LAKFFADVSSKANGTNVNLNKHKNDNKTKCDLANHNTDHNCNVNSTNNEIQPDVCLKENKSFEDHQPAQPTDRLTSTTGKGLELSITTVNVESSKTIDAFTTSESVSDIDTTKTKSVKVLVSLFEESKTCNTGVSAPSCQTTPKVVTTVSSSQMTVTKCRFMPLLEKSVLSETLKSSSITSTPLMPISKSEACDTTEASIASIERTSNTEPLNNLFVKSMSFSTTSNTAEMMMTNSKETSTEETCLPPSKINDLALKTLISLLLLNQLAKPLR